MMLGSKKFYIAVLVLMSFFVLACVVDETKIDESPKAEIEKKEDLENTTEVYCTTETGATLKLGEKLPSDDCNTCVCGEDGEIACTENACVVEEVGGCLDDKGQLVLVGDSFMRECNTCICGESGRAVCTKMGCSSNPIDSIKPIDVQDEVTACTTIALDATKFCALLKDGSEKIFYNKCEAEKLGAKFLYYGECMELVVDPVVCPAIYLPVCAKTLKGELKTFGNSCEANGAKAIIQYEGECLKLVVDPIQKSED